MRLPVAPLVALCGGDDGVARRLGFANTRAMSRGFDWYRAKREGLTTARADEMAVGCGFHPMEVWGEAWLAAGTADDPLARSLKPMRRFREPRWALIRAELEAAS